jgi:hypothetical protein
MISSLKPDPAILGPIDEALTAFYPDPWTYRHEEGVAYWRWLCVDRIVTPEELGVMLDTVRGLNPRGFFRGTVLGKPLTAIFFYPAFS